MCALAAKFTRKRKAIVLRFSGSFGLNSFCSGQYSPGSWEPALIGCEKRRQSDLQKTIISKKAMEAIEAARGKEANVER